MVVVSSEEDRLITGGGDSQLVVWKDVTEENMLRVAAERQARALQDQELSNLLHNDDLLPALRLALTLERPGTVLNIVECELNSIYLAHTHKMWQLNNWTRTTKLFIYHQLQYNIYPLEYNSHFNQIKIC